jgi:hypothetical protein
MLDAHLTPDQVHEQLLTILRRIGDDADEDSILVAAGHVLAWLRRVPLPCNQAAIDAYGRYIYDARREALIAYTEAVTSDGVTASVWLRAAADLAAVAEALEAAGESAGYVEHARARSFDASANAVRCTRMVDAARDRWGASCIEVAS